jgi:hypothetical protein
MPDKKTALTPDKKGHKAVFQYIRLFPTHLIVSYFLLV